MCIVSQEPDPHPGVWCDCRVGAISAVSVADAVSTDDAFQGSVIKPQVIQPTGTCPAWSAAR